MNINEVKVAKNSIPAAARISRSFKTGMLYPSTSSPNCIIFFILVFITRSLRLLEQISKNHFLIIPKFNQKCLISKPDEE